MVELFRLPMDDIDATDPPAVSVDQQSTDRMPRLVQKPDLNIGSQIKAAADEIKSNEQKRQELTPKSGLVAIQEATRVALHVLPGFTYPDVQRNFMTRLGHASGTLAQGAAIGVAGFNYLTGQPVVDSTVIQLAILGKFTSEVSGQVGVNQSIEPEKPEQRKKEFIYKKQRAMYKKAKREYDIAKQKGENPWVPVEPTTPEPLRVELKHESREVKTIVKLTSFMTEAILPDAWFGREVTDPDLQMKHHYSNVAQLGYLGVMATGAASGSEWAPVVGFLGYVGAKLNSARLEHLAATTTPEERAARRAQRRREPVQRPLEPPVTDVSYASNNPLAELGQLSQKIRKETDAAQPSELSVEEDQLEKWHADDELHRKVFAKSGVPTTNLAKEAFAQAVKSGLPIDVRYGQIKDSQIGNVPDTDILRKQWELNRKKEEEKALKSSQTIQAAMGTAYNAAQVAGRAIEQGKQNLSAGAQELGAELNAVKAGIGQGANVAKEPLRGWWREKVFDRVKGWLGRDKQPSAQVEDNSYEPVSTQVIHTQETDASQSVDQVKDRYLEGEPYDNWMTANVDLLTKDEESIVLELHDGRHLIPGDIAEKIRERRKGQSADRAKTNGVDQTDAKRISDEQFKGWAAENGLKEPNELTAAVLLLEQNPTQLPSMNDVQKAIRERVDDVAKRIRESKERQGKAGGLNGR